MSNPTGTGEIVTGTSEIVTAQQDDLPRVIDTLTETFLDDPVFNWLCPDPERRTATYSGWFSVITEAILPHRSIFTTADGGGATVWVPPGQPIADDMEAFAGSVMAVSPEDGERFGTLLGIADEHKPEDPHWYLFFIGVVPDRQGQGIGSTLLRDVLDECDRDAIPAYLEATCEQNKRLYERHGFAVTAELHLPDGPTGFGMWREPQL